MNTKDERLPRYPWGMEPRFQLGDVVTPTGEYANEWQGDHLLLVKVQFDIEKQEITYGTRINGEGMTDEWSGENLRLIERPSHATPKESAITAAFKAGQEDMRERAAAVISPIVAESRELERFYSKPGASRSKQMATLFKSKADNLDRYVDGIRALPIEEPQS